MVHVKKTGPHTNATCFDVLGVSDTLAHLVSETLIFAALSMHFRHQSGLGLTCLCSSLPSANSVHVRGMRHTFPFETHQQTTSTWKVGAFGSKDHALTEEVRVPKAYNEGGVQN